MNSSNQMALMELAEKYDGPIAAAVKAAVQGQQVDAAKLQEGLGTAGFSIQIEKREKPNQADRAEMSIYQKVGERDILIAHSHAATPEDAILSAVLAYLRERDMAANAGHVTHDEFIAERAAS